jgi:O-antigen/teichoic acid export membrane protein
MSLARNALRGASWLSIFRLFSQIYSWVITIQVARLLLPDDYALMAMSTILTGYAMLFSNLGLGSAIIYKKDASKEELSSVFWFSAILGGSFALISIILAYPTAIIFKNPKLIPLTQTVSILFILNALQIVPISIQNRDLKFKTIGLIEMVSTFISSSVMYVMAANGFGVWTLLLGNITLSFFKLVFSYFFTREWPLFYFSFKKVKSFLHFGVLTSIGTSFRYIFEKSDRFFAGRAWGTTALGHYEFALDLSQLPVSKITSIINQVSFPVFSQLQHDRPRFNNYYLTITRLLLIAVCPLFIGGYIAGEDLIKVLLNPKWFSIIPLFKMLCLIQIFTIMSNINNYVHGALGKPKFYLYFNAACAIIMSLSFALTVKYGIDKIWIPWMTSYAALSVAWTFFTLQKIEISFWAYCTNLSKPVIGLVILFVSMFYINKVLLAIPMNYIALLSVKISLSVFIYTIWLLTTERIFLLNVAKQFR